MNKEGFESRALVPAERMVRVIDEGYTMSFSTYARVLGDVTTEAVRRSLDALVRRHPLLGASTAGSRFRMGGAAPIALLSFDLSREALVTRLESELQHQVWAPGGPRARCLLVRHGAAESTLVLTFDHLVSDGVSGVIALRDLLTGIGEPARSLAPIESPGQNAFFPRGRGGVRDLFRALAHANAQRKMPRPLSLGNELDVPLHERRTRIRLVRLVPDDAAALARAARDEGATVHGVLVAVCLLAFADAFAIDQPRAMRVLHPVDLRQCLRQLGATRPIGDAVGYYVSSVGSDHRVARGTEPFALAAEITCAVREAKARGEPLLSAPSGGKVLILARALLGVEGFRRAVRGGLVVDTFSLTNLGTLERLGLARDVGTLSVVEAGFTVSPTVLGAFAGSACSFAGSLSLSLQHVEPLLDSERAQAISGRVLARLDEFVNGGATRHRGSTRYHPV